MQQQKYTSSSDSGLSASPSSSAESQAICAPSGLQSSDYPPEKACDSISLASSDSFPENPDWAVLHIEAVRIQQQQKTKEADLNRKYSSYVDLEPAFLFGQEKIEIPRTVNGVDRVFIKNKIDRVLYNERKANEQVAIYRDKCTELEEKCRQLEREKEAVRYFWRNKVLEGQSRSALMLKKSTLSN